VAQNLERFYRQIRSNLLQAQGLQSAALLEQQIALLMQVREAWSEVEHAEQSVPAPPQPVPATHAETIRRAEWKA
jgi:flagellin-specific chaperone FliS